MKNSILLKVLLILPLLIFVDYVVMASFGGISCAMNCGNDFYCGPYCLLGKIILGLSGLFFVILISPDIAKMFKSPKNVATTEK
ncbi:MAG: hypothetical protein U0W24_15160 [Bacteroidales bacterium]